MQTVNIEIQAGNTDNASFIWAQRLMDMYSKYSASKNLNVRRHPNDLVIYGENVKELFVNECGVHSLTEKSDRGRITTYASVMVDSKQNNNLIRTYVTYPYSLVKDVNSSLSSEDVESVLDGNLGLIGL
jgi:protein subunit release factor B